MPLLDKNGNAILDKRQQMAYSLKAISNMLYQVVSDLLGKGIVVPKLITLEFDENGKKMFLPTDEATQKLVEEMLERNSKLAGENQNMKVFISKAEKKTTESEKLETPKSADSDPTVQPAEQAK